MKLVYTWGVWDLLHVGHIQSLGDVKKLGDQLIVGVFTDAVAAKFKRKPIIPLKQRMEMLRALKVVNIVVMQSSLSPVKNAIEYQVDIVAKGPGATWEKNYKGAEKHLNRLPETRKTKTMLLKYHKGISTSDIINKCKKQ